MCPKYQEGSSRKENPQKSTFFDHWTDPPLRRRKSTDKHSRANLLPLPSSRVALPRTLALARNRRACDPKCSSVTFCFQGGIVASPSGRTEHDGAHYEYFSPTPSHYTHCVGVRGSISSIMVIGSLSSGGSSGSSSGKTRRGSNDRIFNGPFLLLLPRERESVLCTMERSYRGLLL